MLDARELCETSSFSRNPIVFLLSGYLSMQLASGRELGLNSLLSTRLLDPGFEDHHE